jgi:hypothetical protein
MCHVQDCYWGMRGDSVPIHHIVAAFELYSGCCDVWKVVKVIALFMHPAVPFKIGREEGRI